MLLIAGLLSADISARPGRAGAIVVHGWTPPAGPPPAVAAVVAAVVAAERQITSLGAYSDARVYLKVARDEAETAAGAYGRSVREWEAATAKEVRAVAVRTAAKATVNLYDEALCELGIAEYTGIAVRDNLDLASQEREVDEAELGDVAATDTATGLQMAKNELALSIRRRQPGPSGRGRGKDRRCSQKGQLGTATAQLAASRKTLNLARQWVLVPGKAPARPVMALTALEGKVALQVKAERLAALALATRPVINATGSTIEGSGASANATTTSTTTTTTSTTTTTVPAQAPSAAPGVLALHQAGRSLRGSRLRPEHPGAVCPVGGADRRLVRIDGGTAERDSADDPARRRLYGSRAPNRGAGGPGLRPVGGRDGLLLLPRRGPAGA